MPIDLPVSCRTIIQFSCFQFAIATAIAVPTPSAERPLMVLIVAGQSNVLNWHASAHEMSADPKDRHILFYYMTGAPPNRAPRVGINSTSKGDWTVLGPQTQDPFIKYERMFFGPEITLARKLTENNESCAVIKIGYFGTNLAEDWRPGAATGNRLYTTLLAEIARALRQLGDRGHSYTLAGFFWMQGETDAANAGHAAAYAANLDTFIACIRRDLAAPDLPFILGRIGPTPPQGYPYQKEVRNAQQAAAAKVRHAAWVDTDDLTRDSDGVHLLASSVMQLGERWADAWSRLQWFPPEASGSRSQPARNP